MEINTRVRALEYLIQQKARARRRRERCRAFARCSSTTIRSRSATTHSARRSASWPQQAGTGVLPPSRVVELPCCYDPELGLDLVAAAQRLDLSVGRAGAAARGRRVPRVLRRLHAGPALHDRHARAPPPAAPGDAAHEGPAGQRRASAASSAASTRSRARAATGCSAARRRASTIPTAAEPTLLRAGDRVRLRPDRPRGVRRDRRARRGACLAAGDRVIRDRRSRPADDRAGPRPLRASCATAFRPRGRWTCARS